MGGKSEKITITNDKGRLTEEQIEKMIKEAEEFAEEDKLVKERVDARNAFDNYLHSMKSAVEGSGENKGLGEKMDEDEKETVDDAIKDGQDWLSSNPDADTEEIKEKQGDRGHLLADHPEVLPGRRRGGRRRRGRGRRRGPRRALSRFGHGCSRGLSANALARDGLQRCNANLRCAKLRDFLDPAEDWPPGRLQRTLSPGWLAPKTSRGDVEKKK